MMPRGIGRPRGLREWMMVAVVPVVVTLGIVAPAYVAARNDRNTTIIQCQNARNLVVVLQALKAQNEEIGVPFHIPIPEVPPECD